MSNHRIGLYYLYSCTQIRGPLLAYWYFETTPCERYHRLQRNSHIIFEPLDTPYFIGMATDADIQFPTYVAFVYKELILGTQLCCSGIWKSEEEAIDDLDLILELWVDDLESGEYCTGEEMMKGRVGLEIRSEGEGFRWGGGRKQ